MKLRVLIMSSMALLALAVPAAAKTEPPAGLWLWDTGDAAVSFHPCGADLCGRIVWLKDDQAPGATPALDQRNPDASQRTRKICGTDYITGLKATRNGDWRNGRVYDFRTGKSYDLDIDSVDAARVRMRGYMGVRLMGANMTLVRPQQPLATLCTDADPRP